MWSGQPWQEMCWGAAGQTYLKSKSQRHAPNEQDNQKKQQQQRGQRELGGAEVVTEGVGEEEEAKAEAGAALYE